MVQNKLLRMDNMGIVVESLDKAISFFQEIGLKLEGRAMVEGEWAGRVTGLGDQSVEIAILVTPDGHSRIDCIAAHLQDVDANLRRQMLRRDDHAVTRFHSGTRSGAGAGGNRARRDECRGERGEEWGVFFHRCLRSER